MKKLLILIFYIHFCLLASAQTFLTRGDLAIVGVNSTITPSSQDEISFVCFKDITNGTQIQITDNGYEACNSGVWSSAEGGATLTRTGGTIKAGTVMTFRDAYTSGTPIRFTYPDANWSVADIIPNIVRASYVDLNSKGDQIYFAQNGTWTNNNSSPCTVYSSASGSSTTPNGDFPGVDGRILFGFSTSGGWNSLQNSTGESGLYPSMDCFTLALANSYKYNKYTGLLTAATQAQWLSRINLISNWTGYNSSNAYFAAKPDFHSLLMSINPNGLVSNPAWTDSAGFICSNSGDKDFKPFETGTSGGTWSGKGITSNGIFNANGLAGNYDITYTVNYNSGVKICPISQTDSINVIAGTTPTFAPISVLQGSVPPTLPTVSTNIPSITGTWDKTINTSVLGSSPYTFTPNIGGCNKVTTFNVNVIDSSLSPLTNCVGSTLRLTGVSDASRFHGTRMEYWIPSYSPFLPPKGQQLLL